MLTVRVPEDLYRSFSDLAHVRRTSMNKLACSIFRVAIAKAQPRRRFDRDKSSQLYRRGTP
jgi:hypothetical protein